MMQLNNTRLRFKFLKETPAGRKLLREYFKSEEGKKKLKEYKNNFVAEFLKYHREYYHIKLKSSSTFKKRSRKYQQKYDKRKLKVLKGRLKKNGKKII